MAELLTPVSISYKSHEQQDEDILTEVPTATRSNSKHLSQISSHEEALKILKSEPAYATVITILKYLRHDISKFDITSPSPLAAQLVHVLVSDIVSNYWVLFNDSRNDSKPAGRTAKKNERNIELRLLLSCLRSVTGLNAILLSLKRQIRESKESKKAIGGPKFQEVLETSLQVLELLLEGEKTVQQIWSNIHRSSVPVLMQKVIWQEFVSLIGGKVVGPAAEAEEIISEASQRPKKYSWIADGSLHCAWLARNITQWAKGLQMSAEAEWQGCGELLSKSFRLGYTDHLIKEVLNTLLLQGSDNSAELEKLLGMIPSSEQRNFLYGALKFIARDILLANATTEANSQWWLSDAKAVSASAGIITILLAKEESRKRHLIAWLTSSSGGGVGDGVAIRRAAVAALAADCNDTETLLETSLRYFGDPLFIRHAPLMHQEVHAQVLLLSAGYVHRTAPLRLSMLMRSGAHLSIVSDRLASSSPRTRFLGMAVGEALSSLVDERDKRMDFKTDEMHTAEAAWYKSLVTVLDTVQSPHLLELESSAEKQSASSLQTHKVSKPKFTPAGSKVISIKEIEDDSQEELDHDGLARYAKPDSDAEDSDDDPTLVTRNKPAAPVYIRDLINYLRDTENYDKQKLGLSTAASLVRRKANFGTEVTSHAEEIATLLVGLQDKYEIENFHEMRLQGMIAILIALPLKMGQWFCKTFFDGDYSFSQRASILTTLGLGGRELGGFSPESNTLKSAGKSSFPSKTLPENLHKYYNNVPSQLLLPLETASMQLQNTMIAPMATTLADKLTGPSILKVRTFSSRMAVERKRRKPIANEFAKIVSEGFFFPLTGRFFMHLKAYGSSSSSNIVFQPLLLSLFVKTLSLLIHASGPSTLSLSQMTSEYWDLLLSLRSHSIGDVLIIEALLFGFLTILDVNEDKRELVNVHGRVMLETEEWVNGVFGRVGGKGSEEDERVRMLAAACLVKIREVIEKYQALLMGDLASF